MLVCNVPTCSYKASQQLSSAPGIDLLLFTLEVYPMRGRLQLLQIAVLLYCNLAIQQTQLPSDAVPVGSELEFTSSTEITVMEGSIIKHVDHEKQPHLVDQLATLQQLYRATKAS